jgi:outer membrane protein assembly factor BamA
VLAQQQDCVEKDIKDVFRKKSADFVEPKIVIKKPSLILIPVIASSPATGFQFGVAGQGAWYNGFPEDTRISQASANVTVTAKSQVLITVKSTVMSKQDKWIWMGDWRYYFYSQSTYGLGTNSPDSASLDYGINVGGVDTESNPGEQPMDFRWLRLHETVLRQVKQNLFAGVGYHLDMYQNILDKNLDLANGKLTDHYIYSAQRGFDPEKYSISGLSVNVVYDSRDNQINPYKGLYVNGSYKFNSTALGSTRASEFVWLELRAYKGLSATNPRHLLGFWTFANSLVGGSAPYLTLPAANYDMRNRSARAYVQGRFRGEELVYGELEYRFPISPCSGVLGGVVFVNGITASNRETGAQVRVFDYIKAGYGFGLRIAADKLSRTNIAIDVGFGEKSMGIYFGAAEVF